MKHVYCIPKLNQISDFVEFSKAYDAGFEYNDFFLPHILDDEKKVQELIGQYTALDRDRSEDTLHGVFLDMCVNSNDPLIYKATDYRIHQSMEIASQLGVKAVIFHTNHIPNFRLQSYRDEWLADNTTYWKNLMAEYPKLKIYLENMFDEEPDMLMKLYDALADEPQFGVCLDLAHAFISSTPMETWFQTLLPRASHLHINDNDGVEDTHHPVGGRDLPWNLYKTAIEEISPEKRPSVLIEVRNFDALMKSVDYMKSHHLYPFQ